MIVRWLGCALFASLAAQAQAQAEPNVAARPSAVVVMGETPGEPHVAIARAAERVVRARLDSLGVASPVAPPALPLAELALALGCDPDTPMCLGSIASELGATLLVIPSLSAGDDTLVLELRVFDARTQNLPDRVVRSAEGAGREPALFDTIEDALREVLGLERLAPPAATPATAVTREPDTEDTAVVAPSEAVTSTPSVPPVLAWSTAGGALLSFSLGALFGAMSASAESDYANAPTDTPADVDRAIGFRASAERDARIANIALATGGALALVSAVFFVVNAGDDTPVRAEVDVAAGRPAGATFALTGHF